MTRPTVLVYHGDPRYAELVRVPKGRAVVSAAATPSEAAGLVGEAEILYAWKFPPQLYAKAERLKWLQAMGAGVDWAIVPELPPGVILTRAPGVWLSFATCASKSSAITVNTTASSLKNSVS